MAIKELKFDRTQVAENPTWEFVEAALRCLDGENKDGVVLQSTGQSYMGIAGGENGRYAIIGYLEGFGEFICASGLQGGPPQDVVVAGDCNNFASKHVVDINTAVEAAKAFFGTPALSERLKWEKSE